jgi:hypothetical protein
MASDEEQRVEMAKSEFLSPVRLPFRHSGNIVHMQVVTNPSKAALDACVHGCAMQHHGRQAGAFRPGSIGCD